MFQYQMADEMYQNKTQRLQADAKRLICTRDNFNNYFNRVYRKFSKIIGGCIENMPEVFTNNRMYKIKAPNKIVLAEIIGFTLVVSPDAEQISRSDRKQRLLQLTGAFNALTLENKNDNTNGINFNSVDPDDI